MKTKGLRRGRALLSLTGSACLVVTEEEEEEEEVHLFEVTLHLQPSRGLMVSLDVNLGHIM